MTDHFISNVCIIGDFNAIFDTSIDYDPGRGSPKYKKGHRKVLPKTWDNLRTEIGLRDVWRDFYPMQKQFTYFSPRHRSWSRIDMVWSTSDLKEGINSVEIGTNHHPLVIKWKGSTRRARWSMRAEIMKDEGFINMIKKELDHFFAENKREDTSLQNIWDTAKAVVRGLVIKYTAIKWRKEKAKRIELMAELEKAEGELHLEPHN